MLHATSALMLLFFLTSACAQSPGTAKLAESLSGERALEYVRKQVEFGPRPSGSEELKQCRNWIRGELEGFGYQVEDDAFTAQTPYGPIPMHNLIARKGAGDKGVIALATHYETKLMEGIRFVGANDAGSSTGLLLELARVLAESKDGLDYWFIFFDGEEAFIEWSTFDSLYGSRHLAKRWKEEGVLSRIKALILLDMIGDRDLGILRDMNSTPWLMEMVWRTAVEIGMQDILSTYRAAIEDDHLPFLAAGVPAVDIIDLEYGPGNSFWHTEQDTLDKLSAASLEKVGRLVIAVLGKLQERFAK